MDNEVLIWCGPRRISKEDKSGYKRVIELDTFPKDNNVYLRYQNISRRLAQDLPSLILDMLEIGSYVYCADQAVSRGGRTWRGNGKNWIRNFVFDVPVRNPKIWEREDTKRALCETLGFLSDDNYGFRFSKLVQEIPQEHYFDFQEEEPWFHTDEVMLFSGGLDSLAGLIEEVTGHGHNVVLVSHRSVAKISKRQVDLLADFRSIAGNAGEILHVPVWVNKDQGLSKDADQRSRSFLYAVLGATVARMLGLNRIRFYENGIVSMNLPISGQVVGARASRSTHPKVLTGLSRLFTLLFEEDFLVENPFFWKTKTDVVKLIKDSGFAELIKSAHSCSHIRTTTNINTHCGVCSQCIERRLATEYNNIGENDPPEAYKTDLFTSKLEKHDDKTIVESYVRHAQDLESMSPEGFFRHFGEAHRVLQYVNLSTNKAAKQLWELHQRHGQQVSQVIENQIRSNAGLIRRGEIPRHSLLGLIVGKSIERKRATKSRASFPTPEGTKWKDVIIEIKSNNSVRIRIGRIVETYNTGEIGLVDQRKRDLPNKQWELLLRFAEEKGCIRWGNKYREEKNIYQQIARLKKDLIRFFGIDSPPIHNYTKKDGYCTKFEISDRRFGR